ncbi:response regulator [Maricaulis salignorans]|uniref:Response regulator receiver domain-containing protein n=1 Tax=Maricaulis salignorans TaxID=144026 RepID=A0A1G9RMP9_9PROT|nr:response regulator [Maricaulis salignorans]SDM24579.1 Response regulator receiver domain-containing protein [Maricaulis salignorans]
MPNQILLGVRILIVEDVAATRRLIARLLGSLGCHDLIEADGVEGAWQHLNRQQIDLMLLDYELLDGTGIKLMQELRANSASPNQSVPTIMLTGHSEAAVVEQSIRAGADGFLVKPVMPDKLGRRILEVLSSRKSDIVRAAGQGPKTEVQWI